MSPMTKQVYPSPSQRKKRFAKIRETIEGHKNTRGSTKATGTLGGV